MSSEKEITLSLISHTNIGKTTLARTLLRKDIGIVADRAHVTLENKKYTVLKTENGESLRLWDTPGFPNCQKILKRLHGKKNPITRILSEVWDRIVDTPSWCAQQAIVNVQQEADCILYLVNAAEEPSMAGYISSEMQLLEWVGKPIIVLLNQTGPPQDLAERSRLERRWEDHFKDVRFVKRVQSLDAFSRCWVQEGLLFDKIQSILPPEKSIVMRKLLTSWQEYNLSVFHSSMNRLALLLARTATASVMTKGDGSGKELQKQRAVEELLQELKNEVWAATQDLITLHGLEGDAMSQIQARLEDVEFQNNSQNEEAILGGTALGGIGGGLFSGAYAGLHMDAAAGGLSLGLFTLGGAIVGGVIGALGGEAWAARQEGQSPLPVNWSYEYLHLLVQDSIVRYLAIAHFGRGQGQYVDDPEHPRFWGEKVMSAVSLNQTAFHESWNIAREGHPSEGPEEASRKLTIVLEKIILELLWSTYPEGKRIMEDIMVGKKGGAFC